MQGKRFELAIIIKALLFHHRKTDTTLRGKSREVSRQQYFFYNKQVCRSLFSFAHSVNRKPVDRIMSTVNESGMSERVNGNQKIFPNMHCHWSVLKM